MAGFWYRAGTISVTNASKKVVGSGTLFKTTTFKPDKGHAFYGPDGKPYEIDYVESDTVLYLVKAYTGATASGQSYEIDITRTSTIPALSREISAQLAYAQGQYDSWQQIMTGTGDVTLTAPDGQTISVPALSNMLSKSGNLAGLAAPDTALNNLGLTTIGKSVAKAADANILRSNIGLTKQTSANDTTAGSVLLVGAFGLGVTAVDAGPDVALAETRFARIMRILASAASAPTPSTSVGAIVLPIDGGPTSSIVASAQRRGFFGHRDASGAVTWAESWTKENLPAQSSPFDAAAGANLVVGSFGIGATVAANPMGQRSQFMSYGSLPGSGEVPFIGAGWQAAYAANRRAQLFMSTGGVLRGRFSASDTLLDNTTPWTTFHNDVSMPSESGSFTPTPRGDTTPGTFTPGSIRGGSYRRISDICHFKLHVIGTLSGATGYFSIAGLPFVSANDTLLNAVSIYCSNANLSSAALTNPQLVAAVLPNASSVRFYINQIGGTSRVSEAGAIVPTTSFEIIVTGSYKIA